MTLSAYEEVMRQADLLPAEEQLRLIACLAERLSASPQKLADERHPRWEDSAGLNSCPACGEDAQQWVTRTRQESDLRRGTP